MARYTLANTIFAGRAADVVISGARVDCDMAITLGPFIAARCPVRDHTGAFVVLSDGIAKRWRFGVGRVTLRDIHGKP